MALTRDAIATLVESLETLQIEARRQAEHFATLQAFCLFVGYPKSGHSLVGALLDAHPDMVIAHELDCLRVVRAGLGRELLFSLLLDMSAAFRDEGHGWNGYRYTVPGQWQGRFRQLKVIGDKKGGGTSRLLLQYPRLLDRLYATLNLPVRFIHVVRHPGQNIASISREFGVSPEDALELYFSMAESVARLKIRIPADNLYEIRYESFIRNPASYLKEICAFLGQDAASDYLEACAGIVQPSPRGEAGFLPLAETLRADIARRSERFEFLADYEVRVASG
jgi:hypothetical protein